MKKLLTILFLAITLPLFAGDKTVYVHGGVPGFDPNNKTIQEETNYTCDPKPPSKPPAQHSSAEGLPPLPLPVVPLRRTEKKNPPRPPVLVVKIDTGKEDDWNTNPADIENLLKWMAKNLGVNFSSQNRKLKDVLGLKPTKWAKAKEEPVKKD